LGSRAKLFRNTSKILYSYRTELHHNIHPLYFVI